MGGLCNPSIFPGLPNLTETSDVEAVLCSTEENRNPPKLNYFSFLSILKRSEKEIVTMESNTVNKALTSFTATGKTSDDGDIASVMGFSGFGMYSPAHLSENINVKKVFSDKVTI